MGSRMAETTRRARPMLSAERLAGLAVSLPIALVPASAIVMMVWARQAFYQRHPDYVQHSAPTISRAISDPAIGAPFALTILAVTTVILVALVFITRAFQATIAHVWRDDPVRLRRNQALLPLVIGLQVVGSGGMVLCTQYTFSNGHDLHMLGSYLFFVAQVLAIGLNGLMCARLVSDDDGAGDWPHLGLSRRATAFRIGFAKVVVAVTFLYFVLFGIKGVDLPVPEYTVYYVYTVQEIVAISAFILYLMTYSLDVHRMAANAVRQRAGILDRETGLA